MFKNTEICDYLDAKRPKGCVKNMELDKKGYDWLIEEVGA